MNETLIRWIAEGATAAETVARGAGFGLIDPADTEGLTGQQILEEMMAGRFPVPLNAAHECFVVLSASDGQSMLQGMPQQAHLNPMGTVHGGWMTTLMDSAMGNAVLSLLPADKITYSTVDIEVAFIHAMPSDVVAVRAEAKVRPEHATNRTMRATCKIVDATGRAYAFAQGNFRVSRSVLC